MRSTDDFEFHGSGRQIEGDIQIEIEKEAETAEALHAYVYYIQDSRLDIEGGKLIQAI